LYEVYERYIKESGFPQTIKLDNNLIYNYLMDTVYLNTIQKDIISRYNIKDTNKLDSVIKYVFDNIGNETSLDNIVKGLAASKNPTSAPTLDIYIKGMIDSYLIYKCDRYDIKGKKYLNSNAKYYVVDVGLRAALLGANDRDLGHILENIVYLELLRRGYRVSVGKVNSKVVNNNGKKERKTIEVDFIAKKNNLTEYYQVALNALEPEILKRELSPLEEIKDNYPKFLLTLDQGDGENNGIKRLNVLKWLVDK
jgi:predicted AAA+ superfamily ATPase